MISTAPTKVNRTLFTLFAVAGFLVSLVTFQLLMNWIRILAVLYGKPNLGYHDLPEIAHVVQWVLRPTVWLLPLMIFAIDFRKRDFTRAIGYTTGFALALTAACIIFWVQWTVIMSDF